MTLKRLVLVPLAMALFGGLCVLASVLSADAQPAGVMVYSETYDAADTADAAGITNPISAPGAVLGDFCIASVGVDIVDVTISCSIQAAGVAEVRMQNESGTGVDLASTTWRVMVFPRGTR